MKLYKKGSIILSEYIGEAKNEETGEVTEVSLHLGTYAPILKLPSGNYVVFPWSYLVEVAKAYEATNPITGDDDA